MSPLGLLVSPGRRPGSAAQAVQLLDASPCDRQRPRPAEQLATVDGPRAL